MIDIKTQTLINFRSLSKVPRVSFNVEPVVNFLKEFAESNSLPFVSDAYGNVMIEKQASHSRENEKAVVLQAHTDMVGQVADGVSFDFSKDSIVLEESEDRICAKGTTLGADNGVGVAAIMSILSSTSISHPKIKAIFTANEEVGMLGALGLDFDLSDCSSLINLDSEYEGYLIVCSAGGATFTGKLEISREFREDLEPLYYNVELSGLKGEHSGLGIDNPHSNGIRSMAQFLTLLRQMCGIGVSSINGGSIINAIPSKVSAVVAVHPEKKELFFSSFDNFAELSKNRFAACEPNMNFTLSEVEGVKDYIAEDDKVLKALMAIPFRPCTHLEWNLDIDSSSNLSIVRTLNDGEKWWVEMKVLCRGITESNFNLSKYRIRKVFEEYGAEITVSDEYVGWEPNFDSPLLAKCKEAYASLFGEEAVVDSLHAGLECGVIKSKYPHLDAISFGPTIRHPHSTNEYVDVDSIDRFVKYLVEVLKCEF